MDIIIDKINLLNSLIDDKSWIPISTVDGILIEKRKMQGDTYCLRSYSFINANPNILCNYIWDLHNNEEYVKPFDVTLDKYNVIKNYDKDTRLCYQTNNLPWPLWPRELVYLQHRIMHNGKMYILMYSAEPPEIPNDKNKYVRACINVSAFVFIPHQNGSLIYRIMHFDPAGSIPASLVDIYADKSVSIIQYLKAKFK